MTGVDIRNLAIETRKQELDYLQDINREMERAFGPERVAALEDIAEANKKIAERDVGIFDTLLEGTKLNKDQFMTDGQFDYTRFLDYMAVLGADGEDSELYSEAEKILDAYNAMQDSTWAVVDAQIEAYNAQLENVKKMRELRDSLKELNTTFLLTLYSYNNMYIIFIK
jgi:ABC-type phosphate transport system auxiliary subunit